MMPFIRYERLQRDGASVRLCACGYGLSGDETGSEECGERKNQQ